MSIFLCPVYTIDIAFGTLKKTVTPQTIQIFRWKVSTMQLDTTVHSQLSSVTNHERICLFFYFFLIAWKQINNNNFAYTKLIFAPNIVHIMGTSYANETASFSLLWISYFKGFAKFY